jgi:hypothetical protein
MHFFILVSAQFLGINSFFNGGHCFYVMSKLFGNLNI